MSSNGGVGMVIHSGLEDEARAENARASQFRGGPNRFEDLSENARLHTSTHHDQMSACRSATCLLVPEYDAMKLGGLLRLAQRASICPRILRAVEEQLLLTIRDGYV